MPFSSAKLVFSATLAVSALSVGCAAYQPVPLDLPAHETHWRDREPETGLALTPDQAEALALRANPHLRTKRAQAGVALATAGLAGLWEDPNFSIGWSKQQINSTNPWLIDGGIGFSIPLSGRLEVQKKLANHEVGRQQAAVLVAEASVLRELRLALAAHHAAQWRFKVLFEHARRMRALARRAEQIAQAGEASRIEAGALALAAVEAESEATQAKAEIDNTRLRLLEWIGLRPEAPLVIVESATHWAGSDENPQRLDEHPLLAQAKAKYAEAEAAYELEVRRQYPDLNIGPTAFLEGNNARNSALGLGLGLPIPAWNRNRQAIATALAARDAARKEVEEVREDLRHQLAQASAQHKAASMLQVALHQRIPPLLTAQDAQVKALLEVGELDPLRLGEVLDRRRDAALRLAEADRSAAEAQIEVRALVEPVPTAQKPQP